MKTDVIIIGAGPVGLFAVFQAGMLGMKAHVIDALEIQGGQCSALYPEKPIYDIPAHPQVTGAELIELLLQQAAPFAPVYHLNQQAIGLRVTAAGEFVVTTSAGNEVTAKAIVIAAGCGMFAPNKPPLENITEFEGNAVFYSVNQIAIFAGCDVVIAGGGDSAVDWTIALSDIANKIYVVHRRNKFTAAPSSVAKMMELAKRGKVEIVAGYQLDKLIGNGGALEQVVVKDLEGEEKIIKASKLLPFFGLKQELGPILGWNLNLKSHHIEVSQPHYETNIPGIYAAGDIATYPGKLKLMLTGFAEVANALHNAYGRVFDGKALHFEYSTNKSLPLTS